MKDEDQKRIIPVRPGPPPRSYDSFEEAIRGAENHPDQEKARTDTKAFHGCTIVDAWWTDTDHVIRFSNQMLLHIWAGDVAVAWNVTEVQPQVDDSEVERVGSAPIILRFGGEAGDYLMDRSSLAKRRRGRLFRKLFVNEMGLLVYTDQPMIWWFGVVYRSDTDRRILYVHEDD